MIIYEILGPFFLALALGGAIGLERSHSGHAAGFRTYSLVSLASTMLMWVASSDAGWDAAVVGGTMMSDPSRVVQGILTGIGFLGAGVIVKDGFTVRGLTTAASIWVTASLGIMVGSGQYLAACVATLITLAALTVFRHLERLIPRRHYARFTITFNRDTAMKEQNLRELVAQYGYKVDEMSYALKGAGTTFEYYINMWSGDASAHAKLVQALSEMPEVLELSAVPSRD